MFSSLNSELSADLFGRAAQMVRQPTRPATVDTRCPLSGRTCTDQRYSATTSRMAIRMTRPATAARTAKVAARESRLGDSSPG